MFQWERRRLEEEEEEEEEGKKQMSHNVACEEDFKHIQKLRI
jgi:hypothetical protein